MSAPKTMKAVIYTAPNTVELVEKEVPVPEEGEVVCKITASGLCGSDLHTYRGHTSGLTKLGFTMGHEFVGTVSAVPSSGSSFEIGDRVVSPFTISCGECFFCEKGFTGRCVKSKLFGGDKLEGCQAEYVRVPMAETTLFHAPTDLPDAHLLMMADIFPTGCSVVRNAWNMMSEAERVDATCVVIGCGPVGLCAIMAAKERFAKVYAIDPVAERRDIAKKYGAHPIDPAAGDPAETLRSLTASRGPDAVLEVVGNPAALSLALQLVRLCGVVSSCGVHNHQLQIEGDVAYGKGFRLQFGRCHARAMFAESLELLKKISRDTPDLIDGFVQKKVKLEDAVEYYRLFDQQKVGKVMFDLA